MVSFDHSFRDLQLAKAMSFIEGDFAMFTREEAEAGLRRMVASGEMEEDGLKDGMIAFNTVVEFTDDHRVVNWMKLPEGVSEEDIKEAVAAGEIGEVRDGMFVASEKEWKALDGKYYYDTGEHREVFGEVKSPWDELKIAEDGTMLFGDGMMLLRRIG